MNWPLHPDVAALAFLLGEWRGRGRGDYPTIDAFTYEEVVTIGHVGKPFLEYEQRTRDESGRPMHTEVGYFRPGGDTGVELVIAQPTGITELHVGQLDGTSIRFRATEVTRTPTAKSVVAVARAISVTEDEMQYRLDMAAVGQDLQYHLEATLHRTSR